MIEDTMVTILPSIVVGTRSPYPIVVRETVAQYSASKKFRKPGSIWKITRAAMMMYDVVKASTAFRGRILFLITARSTLKLWEYSRIFRDLSTLARRVSLSSINVMNSGL